MTFRGGHCINMFTEVNKSSISHYVQFKTSEAHIFNLFQSTEETIYPIQKIKYQYHIHEMISFSNKSVIFLRSAMSL